jgi:hypothetical protein
LKSALGFAVAAFCVATALPACSTAKGSAEADAGAGTSKDGATHGPSADGGKPSKDAASSSGCKTDEDCTEDQECSGGTCVTKAVCPMGLEPTFDSLRTKIFSVSCGTDGNACHSHGGSVNSGGLNLADDPYTALLGADGKGTAGNNIGGSERNLVRVVPGAPDRSFLVIKLSTRTNQDPRYGSGMPFTDPGSVCPDTLATVKQWIASGAKK